MAFLGDLLNLAHVLKRAYDLYQGFEAAPKEIRQARDYIHSMALCLEGVNSDIVNNKHSFVHQPNDLARIRTHALKKHIGDCDKALQRMGTLLAKYYNFKRKHVSLWDRFCWSTEGKKEIAEAKSDLVFYTAILEMFLSKENLNVLWKVESMIEQMMNKMSALERIAVPAAATGTSQRRSRSGSSVTRTIVVSLVLARLRKTLRIYRRKTMKPSKKSPSSSRKPKTVTRTNSGFANNKKRNNLVNSYAASVAAAASPPPYTAQLARQRPRTPSPDFHYIPGGSSRSPVPRPVRRSSSMDRIMARLNVPVVAPREPAVQYRCWKVGVGKMAFGPKTAPIFLPYHRGQAQLRKLGEAFKEASAFDARALLESDKRVELILKKKNSEEKSKKHGKKWYFVSGRIIAKDPGSTGMVTVEKALVVLVRR